MTPDATYGGGPPNSNITKSQTSGITVSYQQALFSYPDWFNGAGWHWSSLISAAQQNPNVQIFVAINPNSGPDVAQNSDFVQGITNLRAANNIKILGYVFTNFGARAQSGAVSGGSVQGDVDSWVSFYPTIDGIFLDQMKSTPGSEAYYTSITNYIHSKPNYKYVWGNPGVNVAQSYVGTVDTILISEGPTLPTLTTIQNSTFSGAYNQNNFAITAYNVSSLDSNALKQASQYVGYIFVTDQGNGFISQPSYLTSELNLMATTARPSQNVPRSESSWNV